MSPNLWYTLSVNLYYTRFEVIFNFFSREFIKLKWIALGLFRAFQDFNNWDKYMLKRRIESEVLAFRSRYIGDFVSSQFWPLLKQTSKYAPRATILFKKLITKLLEKIKNKQKLIKIYNFCQFLRCSRVAQMHLVGHMRPASCVFDIPGFGHSVDKRFG